MTPVNLPHWDNPYVQEDQVQPRLPVKTKTHFSAAVRFSPVLIKREMAAVEGINAKIAVLVTKTVGTMACAYVFALIALISLPAAVQSGQVIILVAWVAQTFLQLVLLSIIMVGQRVGSATSDARSQHEFENTVAILDALSTQTEGGLKTVLDAVQKNATYPGPRPPIAPPPVH